MGAQVGCRGSSARGRGWILLAAVVSLAGCATGPPTRTLAQVFGLDGAPAGVSAATPAPAPSDDPVLAFVARAETGATTTLAGASGQPVTVVAGESYFAASGRTCRRYRLAPPGGSARAGLACRTHAGAWERVDVIVNPDSLDGPSRLLRLAPRTT